MKQPLLSIITVCKDNVQDLHITLGSIVDSLPLEKIEIIVVSGSSDENFDCELQLFPDISQIKIHRSNPLGVYSAMNYGLTLYNGSWVWFLNSGDLCSISDSDDFVTILSSESNSQSNALLFYGAIRSIFSIYPIVRRPSFISYIDKDKWFKSYPCMHPCIIVSSTSLSKSSFRYSTINRINADQAYIKYFQNLPQIRSFKIFIAQFTLGGLSTKGPFTLLFNFLALRVPRFVRFLDDGLILFKLFTLDIIRSLSCIK